MRALHLFACLILSFSAFAERICGLVKSVKTQNRNYYILKPSMTQSISSDAIVNLDVSDFALGRINTVVNGKYYCLDGEIKQLVTGLIYLMKVKDFGDPKEIFCGTLIKSHFRNQRIIIDKDGVKMRHQIVPSGGVDFESTLDSHQRYCFAGDQYPAMLMVSDILSIEALNCPELNTLCEGEHADSSPERESCLEENRFKVHGIRMADTLICPEDKDYCAIARAKCQKQGYVDLKSCPEPVDIKCY